MRLHLLLGGLGLACGLALAAGGCEEGRAGVMHRCTCQVTCDGAQSVWITEVCRKNDDPRAAADLAAENCEAVHDGTCAAVTCACSGCTELQAMEEC